MSDDRDLVRVEHITQSILMIRGQRVMLDSDLAALYGVTTKRFNEQVKRNRGRFPPDFMFQLTADEAANLRSQLATSSSEYGGRRYAPFVFTEHGAIMAASVLNSACAIEVSVYVVRAFVKLKEMLAEHKELAARLTELERRFATHDTAIREIVDAIRRLAVLPPPEPEGRQIGFKVKEAAATYRRKRSRSR